MQQFAANARTQSRPPIALFSSMSGGGGAGRCSENESRGYHHHASTISTISSSHAHNRHSSSIATAAAPSSEEPNKLASDDINDHLSSLQQMIASRRTVSNFDYSTSHQQTSSDREFLRAAIRRAVQCAVAAPNHKLTEPTTFHRILSQTAACERLLDIAYETTLQRLLDRQLSGAEACQSEALRKKEKWSKIPAFVVATVSGMDDQIVSNTTTVSMIDMYKEQQFIPPTTIQQLEDYASACASIQNLLLSLHSENLGCKWATGPIIQTRTFRNLIGCEKNDMIVGLIMIGLPKRLPRMRRRRREIDGDVLRDVEP